MYKKYSKPFSETIKYRDYLISDAQAHIAQERDFENAYNQLPIRDLCILCFSKLSSLDLFRNGNKYIFCDYCGHLNGNHILTENLALDVYQNMNLGVMNYDEYYLDKPELYLEKVNQIYLPKAEFFLQVLESENLNQTIEDIEIADFGTGSGHMVKAFRDIGFTKVRGLDPMRSAINHGREIIGAEGLDFLELGQSLSFLRETSASVISMLCTLPHVSDHHETMSAMQSNANIIYTYQKLPLFSLGAILDVLYPESNSRTLSGGHTHLYTNESLAFLEKQYKLERVGEWRFGSDALDLYNNIMLGLKRIQASDKSISKVTSKLLSALDGIQEVIDKNDFQSEIHIVWKFLR